MWIGCAVIMMLSLCNFVMLMFGSWYFYPRLCGTILNCLCGYCCMNGVSISLMSARFSITGELCSYNVAPVNYKGDESFDEGGSTYKDDASLLLAFGAIQFILSCA